MERREQRLCGLRSHRRAAAGDVARDGVAHVRRRDAMGEGIGIGVLRRVVAGTAVGPQAVDVDAVSSLQSRVDRRRERIAALLLQVGLARRTTERVCNTRHSVEHVDREDVHRGPRHGRHVVAIPHSLRPVDDAVEVVAVTAGQVRHQPRASVDRCGTFW